MSCPGGAEAWKRALVDVVLEHAALGDAHASIATFDPGADACRGGAGGAVAFCDAWARLKDGGAVARVQARVPGATPDLGACKTAAALEHCKRANRLFGFPLCFFVGNVSRGDGAPRELWCVGASKSNLQPDFNVSVRDRFDTSTSAVLRDLDESNRFVQKSAESTSI